MSSNLGSRETLKHPCFEPSGNLVFFAAFLGSGVDCPQSVHRRTGVRTRGVPQKTVDALREKAVPPAPHRPLRHPGPTDRPSDRVPSQARDDARPPGALPEASRVARDPFEARAVPIRKPGFPSCRFPTRPPLSRFAGRSQRRRENDMTLPKEIESLVLSHTLVPYLKLIVHGRPRLQTPRCHPDRPQGKRLRHDQMTHQRVNPLK